jgi:hypothetical protein
MIGVCMWPPPAIFLGRRTDFATNAVATLLAGGRFGRMAVALVASLLPPLPSRPSGSLPRFLQVAISVIERAIRMRFTCNRTPPFGCWCKHPIY